MDTLPHELLCEIYPYVSWPGVLVLPRVCKAWREVYTLPDELWEVTDKLMIRLTCHYTILIGKCPPPPIDRAILNGIATDWDTYYRRSWSKISRKRVLACDFYGATYSFCIGRIEAIMKPIDLTQEEIDAAFFEAMIVDVTSSADSSSVYTLVLNKGGKLIALYYGSTVYSTADSSAQYRPRRDMRTYLSLRQILRSTLDSSAPIVIGSLRIGTETEVSYMLLS